MHILINCQKYNSSERMHILDFEKHFYDLEITFIKFVTCSTTIGYTLFSTNNNKKRIKIKDVKIQCNSKNLGKIITNMTGNGFP